MGAEPTDQGLIRSGRPGAEGSTRARLLDAAESVVLEYGAVKLTLDAVAKAAGVSKGGLLYHFPTKESLIVSLVERLCDLFDSRLDHHAGRDPEPVGRMARAYIAATLELCLGDTRRSNRLDSALLAAVAGDGALMEPLRRRYLVWRAMVAEDGLAAEDAMTIQLAMDGLWFTAMLSLEPPRSALLSQVIDRLKTISRGRATTAR